MAHRKNPAQKQNAFLNLFLCLTMIMTAAGPAIHYRAQETVSASELDTVTDAGYSAAKSSTDLAQINSVSIQNNNFQGNGQFGLSSNIPIVAQGNWWGDASGPTHPSNPTGTGDAVNDNVGFDPWLASAVDIGFSYPPASEPGTIVLSQNSFEDNGTFGVQSSISLIAENNWWGHPSGPYHPTTNPDGQGNEVSDNIDYDPWLVTPPGDRKATPLALDVPVNDSIGPFGFRDYSLEIGAGLSLLLEVVPAGGSNGLWVYSRLGSLPLWTYYDLRVQEPTPSGSYELLISPTQSGAYYFSVYGRDISGFEGQFTIVARTVDRYLSNVSPRAGGNTGQVTLSLSGLGFVEGVSVQLRSAGLPALVADTVELVSPTSIWAVFDLQGASVGTYDVHAVWPGAEEEFLTDAFTINPGLGPRLQANFVAPEAVRAGRPYVLRLDYSNVGDADLPAPLLRVEATNAELRFPEQESFIGSSIQFVATSSKQPADVLVPGASGSQMFVFRALNNNADVSFSVSQLSEVELQGNQHADGLEVELASGAAAQTQSHPGMAAPDGGTNETPSSDHGAIARTEDSSELPELIHNTRFVDAEVLGLSQIQSILDAFPGALKSHTVEANGRTVPASQILINASFGHGYTVSPRVLLAILEMKNGWVTTPDLKSADFDRISSGAGETPTGFGRQLRLLSDSLGLAYLDYANILPKNLAHNAASFAVRDILRELGLLDSDAELSREFVKTYDALFNVDPRQRLEIDQSPIPPFLHKPFDEQYPLTFPGFGRVNSFYDHDKPHSTNGKMRLFTGDELTGNVHKATCDPVEKCYDGHDGIDYRTRNESVTSAAVGTIHMVCLEGTNADPSKDACLGDPGPYFPASLGNFVVVTHTNSYNSVYGHLDSIGTNPRTGQPFTLTEQIELGEILGVSGCSGGGCEDPYDHLHFVVIRNGNPVDPFGWWDNESDPTTAEPSYWLWSSDDITDDSEASFQRFSRDNWHELATDSAYLDHAWWTWAGSKTENWAVWGLRVPHDGWYHIQAYIPQPPAGAKWTAEANYQVFQRNAAGGLSPLPVSLTLNQKHGLNNWNTLNEGNSDREFYFTAGTMVLVKLTDLAKDAATKPRVIFDAIRLHGLSSPEQGYHSVTLQWSGHAQETDGYLVYRNDSPVSTTGPNDTSFVDSPLYCDTWYGYQVRSLHNGVLSDPSNMVREHTGFYPLCDYVSELIGAGHTRVIRPVDPNEKTGPLGSGQNHVVAPGEDLHYTVYFENLPAATAPAQEVIIIDQLDPGLDPSTLRFNEVVFGDTIIPIAGDDFQFEGRRVVVDHRPEITKTWWLDISGEVDPTSGEVRFTFRTLDPETGELPADPFAGFLPPNDGSHRGEGHISFSIRHRNDLPLGTVVTNSASIVFDTNEPIITNEVWNTIGELEGDQYMYMPLLIRQ